MPAFQHLEALKLSVEHFFGLFSEKKESAVKVFSSL